MYWLAIETVTIGMFLLNTRGFIRLLHLDIVIRETLYVDLKHIRKLLMSFEMIHDVIREYI